MIITARLAGKKVKVIYEFNGDTINVHTPFFKPLIDEIKAMKGAKWNDPAKMWTIDNCRRNLFAFTILQNEGLIKRYDLPINIIRTDLWKHQNRIHAFEMIRQRCIIGSEPRTGKTRPTIQAALDSEHSEIWFVSKKNALLGIPREFAKWWGNPIPMADDEYIVQGKYFKLMSYDKFTALMNRNPSKIPGFVIFDECHSLKTPGTQRSNAASKLADCMEDKYKGSDFVIGLSGTPAPKDPSDWWQQCEIVRPGYIREGDINKFRKRYGYYKPWDEVTPAWERFQGWNKDEVSKLYTRLGGLVQIHFQKDCFDLPETQYVVCDLKPDKTLLRVAKMITETATSALEARRRLRQISDGFEYTKEYDAATNEMKRTGFTFVGTPKIDQLKSDLEEYEGVGRLCIYAGFQASIDIISKTCIESGWTVLQIDGRGTLLRTCSADFSERESINLALGEMDRSTDTGTIQKLAVVAETDAGGAGFEFSASPCIIYYSNGDAGEGRMQSEFRIRSANMDVSRGAVVKDYCLLPTDYLIRQQLLNKKELQALTMGEMARCFNDSSISSMIQSLDTPYISKPGDTPW